MTYEEKIIWKIYPEFPFIEVNQFGEIRTKDRTVIRKNGRKCFVKGHVLKQYLTKDGYSYVHFGANGKTVSLRVHRVVAICFIPNPLGLPEVNHIDCDPTNNRWDNLEWCTHEYNTAYREKYGVALNHPVIAINSETSEVFWFESQREAARQLGADQGHICSVIKGKRNTAGGCWFCDADENSFEKVRVKFGDEVADKVKELMKGD